MRIQKFLANYGVASRRKIEEMIQDGRIKVDGQFATLGCPVDHKSKITIDNVPFIMPASAKSSAEHNQQQILLYHKPVGVICTRDDPQDRDTVFSDLPEIENGDRKSVV